MGHPAAAAVSSRSRALRIGLIADTHGLMRPEALRSLRGTAHIIHGGDIGDPAILEALRKIAPVTAVRGNNDRERWARAVPERAEVKIDAVASALARDERGPPR